MIRRSPREYQRLAALRDAIRRHAPREAAPQALAERIAALMAPAPPPQAAAAPSATVVPLRRRAWFDSRALAMAASFAVLGFAVGAGVMSLRAPPRSGDVAQHLVSDFARAAIAGQPFDVASSDRHTVKPWLADRTTVSATHRRSRGRKTSRWWAAGSPSSIEFPRRPSFTAITSTSSR